jgi:SAM-dependent methyltransferase
MTPAERIIGLYEQYAAEWDKDRGHFLFEKTELDRFLVLLPPGASILDVGCGSAFPIARYFIEQGHHVTGIDSSASLIGICRNRFPEDEWVVSDMRELSLSQRFDGILAWDSFFHLRPEDQRIMFPIFRSHAAPKAALMFTTGPMHGEVLGEYKGEPLYHGSLDGAEYRSLLYENGFDVVSHFTQDPACGGHMVWLAQLR